MRHYPDPSRRIPLGEVGVTGDGTDLAIVTFGNGVYLSQQALPAIRAAGIAARIVDMRWISPLPKAGITAAVQGCAHVLVVDETRHSGGVAEAVMAHLAETSPARIARITAEDSFIATGPAYAATMPSKDGIAAAALRLMGMGS
jgi:2-oxoisovalerate dehydrogenase E1 component